MNEWIDEDGQGDLCASIGFLLPVDEKVMIVNWVVSPGVFEPGVRSIVQSHFFP